MKVKRYHECPECHRISPYFQTKCDCGYYFSDVPDERQFKTCPSCGLMVPASQLVCDCGKFLPFCKDTITDTDIELAYDIGRRMGIAQERSRNDREWNDFFARAGLKNSITGEPVSSRDDFAKWESDYNRAVKAYEGERRQNEPQPEPPRENTPPPPLSPVSNSDQPKPSTDSGAVSYVDGLKSNYKKQAAKAKARSALKIISAIALCALVFYVLFGSYIKDSMTPVETLTPVSFVNGGMVEYPSGERLAPLTVKTGSADSYLVVLKPFDDVAKTNGQMAFLISAGKSVETNVPLGEYEIYYACGPQWYGRSAKFGEETEFYKCSGTFDFSVDSEGYNGWTLTLYTVASGNMRTSSVSEGKFPDIG